MRRRDVALGLVALGAIAAGVFLVRWGSTTATSVDELLPDVTLAAATADAGGARITLSVTPNPPVVLARFRVRVRAEANGSPVAIENGRVSFEMAMPMGDHRYTLVRGVEGWQEAAIVLPT